MSTKVEVKYSELVGQAVIDSFKKLNPRDEIKNLVMFVVWLGSIWTTSSCSPRAAAICSTSRFASGCGSPACSPTSPKRWPKAAARPTPMRCAKCAPRPWPANSSMARKSGARRRAEDRRSVRLRRRRHRFPLTAKSSKASPPWTNPPSPANPPRSSAKAAATAAPSPAARRSSATGSSSASPPRQGNSFLDRMISMIEGARRQKTPNEIALEHRAGQSDRAVHRGRLHPAAVCPLQRSRRPARRAWC